MTEHFDAEGPVDVVRPAEGGRIEVVMTTTGPDAPKLVNLLALDSELEASCIGLMPSEARKLAAALLACAERAEAVLQ